MPSIRRDTPEATTFIAVVLAGFVRAAGSRMLALVVMLLLAAPVAESRAGDLSAQIAARLESDAALVVDGHTLDRAQLRRFYATRAHAPVWIGDGAPGPRLADLVQAIARVDRDALRPERYRLSTLERRLGGPTDPAGLLETELLASDSLILVVRHLHNGRVAPNVADPETHPAKELADTLPLASRVAAAADVAHALDATAPTNPNYRRLRRALALYREIETGGGWPALPEGPTLRPGERDQRVRVLRARLFASRDLTITSDPDDLYDPALELAVRGFQARHGLVVDGLVGPQTRATMNVDVATRLRQIATNMERWRWMPDDLGRRYIMVNIAGFELEVVEDGSIVMDMRVIVGRTYRTTPVFSELMTYLEINPYWNVPDSIARNDILPRVRANPNYLREQGIRVLGDWSPHAVPIDPATIDWHGIGNGALPFRFRQDPGPQNALGRIKFMFPNRFAVYLHDTPSRELFDRTVRTFSSGCIRIERPYELGAWLLRGTALGSAAALRAAIDEGGTRAITLPEPIRVHLTYATAWVGEGGEVHFRDDVYGRDESMLQALVGVDSGRVGG